MEKKGSIVRSTQISTHLKPKLTSQAHKLCRIQLPSHGGQRPYQVYSDQTMEHLDQWGTPQIEWSFSQTDITSSPLKTGR